MKKRMIKTSLAFLLASMIQASFAQTIHYITFVATDDQSVGIGSQVSLNLMKAQLKRAASQAGMSFRPVIYAGSRFTKANLNKVLNSFSCGNDDVIFFSYIGHGFRFGSTQSDFPYLLVKPESGDLSKSQMTENSIHLTQIFDRLKQKGARLLITMAEACNNAVNPTPYPGFTNNLSMEKDAYRALFRLARGAFIISSSIPGQYSWTNSKNGGFFTNGFINALKAELGNGKDVKWNNLLQRTVNYTTKISEHVKKTDNKVKLQIPQYKGKAAVIPGGIHVRDK